MKQTLKETYKNRLLETLIAESFDKRTADKAIQLIKKLNAIQWPPELSLFKTATKQAVAELSKILAGKTDKKGFFDKLINIFKTQNDNPFVDVVAYMNAINSFFKTLAKYIDAIDDKSATTIGELYSDDDRDTFYDIVNKGLKPEGLIGDISSEWAKKYLKDNTAVQDMADQLMTLPIATLKTLANNITSALSDINNVSNSVAGAQQAVDTQKTVPVDTEPSTTDSTKAATQTKTTTPTSSGNVQPGKQRSTLGDVTAKKKAVAMAKSRLEDIGVKDVQAVIDILDDLDLLKD